MPMGARTMAALTAFSAAVCLSGAVVAATLDLSAIFEPWDRADSPGLVAGVYRDGQRLWSEGYGLASLELGVTNDPATRFNAGSIAKQFTATAILMLEERGLLDLDDRVRRYVPELHPVARRITLRQLLHHTSGLRDIWALTDLGGWQPADVRTTTQALRILSRQQRLNFTPGMGFGYSNSGYLLLAEVVRRITDESFPAWMRANIFEPAGMRDTSFYDDPAQLLPGTASPYRSLGRGRGFARDELNSGLAGGGNLVTTAADLGRWSAHLLESKVGGAPLIERLSAQGSLPDGQSTGYGMGMFVGAYRGLPVAFHGGANAGYRSHLMIFAEQGIAIVVLGNVNTIQAEQLARSMADIVVGEDLAAPDPRPATSPVPLALPPDSMTGRYALGQILLEVIEFQDTLYFRIGGGDLRPLLSTGPTTYITFETGVSLVFQLDEDDSATSVELQVPGRTLSGERLRPATLAPADARAYEGRYYSKELDTAYRIEYENGQLIARHLRGTDIVLTAYGQDRFLEAAGGDLSVSFDRSRRGRIVGFEMSVDRARGITFERI